MDATTEHRTAELDALRRRRAELRESMGALERALAAAATGRPVVWGERVHEALHAIADDWREHVVVTEGPGGLHESIVAGAVRLANPVSALAEEHELIASDIAEAIAATEAPVVERDVETIRARATDLFSRLARHRQRGADLIYEAYATDIGGGD
jgi:hypothetical protein